MRSLKTVFASCISAAIIICASVSCSLIRSRNVPAEVILFSKIGNRPFDDSIFTIYPDGSGLRQFLKARRGRSYLSASGHSIRGPFAVVTNEIDVTGNATSKLYIYDPTRETWQHIETEGGIVGDGIISPNNVRVAFTLFKTNPKQYELRIVDLRTGDTKKFSEEEGRWYSSLAWHPNGRSVFFLRLERTGQGVVTKLMSVSVAGGGIETILDEPVAGFCFAPDGNRLAIWTTKGLEILRLPEVGRSVVLSSDNLQSKFESRAGGLSWSKTRDSLAFVLFNKETGDYELWTVSTDGTNVQSIHKQKGEKLIVSSFLRT